MSALSLALLLALASPGRADGPPRATRSVVYALASRLYLDAGAEEGLAPGQVLALSRNGRKVGTCKVADVSDKHASCVGPGAVGDVFPVSPRAAPAAPARPAQVAPAVLEQRRAIVESAPFAPVDYKGQPGELARARTVDARVAHLTWASSGAGPWQEERADLHVRGAPIGKGFTLDADLSARHWSRRFDPISFRPADSTQLYVWEAAVSRRLAGGGAAVSLGRVRPWWAPGQFIFDGAQVGYRSASGLEAGLFGGTIPDEVTLAPSFERGVIGAYWTARHLGDAESVIRYFQHDGRVALAQTADLKRRVEGEGLWRAQITRMFDASADLRLGFGEEQAPGAVDAIRLDGSLRPVETLSFSGSWRYENIFVSELDGPGRVLPGGRGRHAEATASWLPETWVGVSIVSGLSNDVANARSRRWLGPEVDLPRLLGDLGSASAGYFQEEGWSPGRSAWLQLILRARQRAQLLLRVSWFRSQDVAPVDLDEFGASAVASMQLSSHISLRISALGRVTLNGATQPFANGTGRFGTLDAGLGGEF
jgi:hypothetical protein